MNMKIGIMQPYFFPYIGYWQLINYVDEYVIFNDVHYIKRGWINRNNILVNGNVFQIHIPLQKASQNKLISETVLAQTDSDKDKLLKTIELAYKKAPYFDKTFELIEKIMSNETSSLAEFLSFSIKEVCLYLGIKTELILSSEIEKDNSLKAEKKIIEICKKRNADCYVNSVGGKMLYDKNNFRLQGLELMFLCPNEILYKQFSNQSVPNLSIIDVLMFNSIAQVQKMLHEFRIE